MKKKWLFIIIIIAVAAISLFLFLQSNPTRNQNLVDGSSDLSALSFPVERKDISNTVEIKGKTTYGEESWIYAPFSSTVKQWHVEEGQSVAEGTVLFELDNVKLRNEIALTEAQLLKQQLTSRLAVSANDHQIDASVNEGQQAFDRFAKKEESRLQQQLDKVQLTITESDLKDKKDRLQQAAYTSSKSGIFLFAEQQKPKTVDQDVPLGKIVELTSLQLLCTVTEYDIFRIKEGMEVDIRIDAQAQMRVKGIVEHVSKFAKTGTDKATTAAQFEVRISLDQSDELIAGLSLTGKITTARKENALVVPTIAVMHEDEQYFVYATTPTGVEKKVITIGIETPEMTEVVEGLSEGDTVVLQ